MTKIAVLSDIHGNIVALDSVLKDAKEQGVDTYIFAGDLVNELPFGNEVIERVKNLKDTVCVKGNKEQYLIDFNKIEKYWNNIQVKNTKFMYDQLSDENRDFINSLPIEQNKIYNGVSMKIVHATPYSLTDIIREDDIESIDKLTKEAKTDFLICGHTHDPIWYKQMNDTMFLNAGCLGMSTFHSSKAEYVIIDIKGPKDYSIEKRLIDYDLNKLIDMISKSDIMKIDRIFMNLMCLVINGRPDIRKKVFTESYEIMQKRGESVFKENVPDIFSKFKFFDDDVWLEVGKKYEDEFLIK